MYRYKKSLLFVFIALFLTAGMFSLTATGRNTKPRGFWDDGDWGDFLDFWESDSGEENSGKTPEAPGAQPWMVALVDRNVSNAYDGQFCGGSLIDAQWVLTAAHCVEGESASSIDAVIGRYELSSNEGQRIHVAQIITHPNYDDYTTENDIALLQLAQPASVGQPIDIIDDAREQFDDPTIVAHVSGWGVIPEQNDNFPDELHGVDVPIATQANCSNVYDESIPGTMLCAGQTQGGADSCEGDSGGPLVVQDSSGGWLQAGIVSWGDACGIPNSYGVYTRLTEFEPWIDQVLGGDTTVAAPAPAAPAPAAPAPANEIDETAVSIPGYTLVDSSSEGGEQFATYENGSNYVELLIADNYSSLDEWFDDVEFEPYAEEWQTVNGVELVLVDWTDNDGTFSEAMIYVDGQLINVYGTITPETMLTIVAHLLS